MHWRKCDLWKAGIAIIGMLILMVRVSEAAADTHGMASGLTTPATITVQATPTEDATVTVLNKEQLTQQVAQQQHTDIDSYHA